MSNFENCLKAINERVIYLFKKEEYEKVFNKFRNNSEKN